MTVEVLAYQADTSQVVGLWAGTALILLGGVLVVFSSLLLIRRWSRRERVVLELEVEVLDGLVEREPRVAQPNCEAPVAGVDGLGVEESGQ